MRKTLSLGLFLILMQVSAATEIKVPEIWKKPGSPGIRQVGFYQGKEKYIWAFASEKFKNTAAKKLLYLGIYINIDNDTETGRFPGQAGYDVQFNIKLYPVRTINLIRWETGVKSPFKLPAYQDDYLIKQNGDVLFFAIKKSILSQFKMGKKYTMRLLFAGLSPVSFTVDNTQINSATPTVRPPLNFIRFGENISLRHKVPYAEIISEASGIKVWNSFMERYEPHEKFPEKNKKIKVLKMSAARGESESLQLGITTGKVPKQIKLEASELEDSNGKIIPSSAFEVEYVGYVINHFNKSYGDVLLPEYRPYDALNNFVLITVKVPDNTAAGVYKGRFRLRLDDKDTVTLPLQLRVFDFALPEVPGFSTAFCVKNAYISGFFKAMGKPITRKQHKAQWQRMRDLCSKYRIGPRFLGAKPELKIVDGSLKIDWDEFDKAMNKYFKTDKFAIFQMVHFVQMGSHGRIYPKPPFFNKKTPPDFNDPVFRKLWPEYIKALYQHLKEKNYLNRVLFVIWDEPYASEYKNIDMLAKLAKQAAPGLQPGVFIEHYEKEIAQNIDIWLCAARFMGAFYKPDKQRKLWLYNDGRMGSFVNPASDLRSCFWQAWKYNLQGYLNSEIDAWTWGWPKSFNKYHNLAATHMWFYPDPDQGMPHASLRMALIRDGIDDYEYLKLFAQKLVAARTRKHPGLQEAEELQKELQKIMPAFNRQKRIEFKIDSIEVMNKWRNRIAEQIIRLSK